MEVYASPSQGSNGGLENDNELSAPVSRKLEYDDLPNPNYH